MISNGTTYNAPTKTEQEVSQKPHNIKIFVMLVFGGLSLLALIFLIVWLTKSDADDESNNPSQNNSPEIKTNKSFEIRKKKMYTSRISPNNPSKNLEDSRQNLFGNEGNESLFANQNDSTQNGFLYTDNPQHNTNSFSGTQDNDEMRPIKPEDLSLKLLNEDLVAYLPHAEGDVKKLVNSLNDLFEGIRPSWIEQMPEWLSERWHIYYFGLNLIEIHFLVMRYQREDHGAIMNVFQRITNKNMPDIYMGDKDDEQPRKISLMSVKAINQAYKDNKTIYAIIDTKRDDVHNIKNKPKESWKIPDEEMRSIMLEDLSPILLGEGSKLPKSAIECQIISSKAMPKIKTSWIKAMPEWVISYAKKAGRLREIYVHMHFLVMRYQPGHHNDIMNALKNTCESLQWLGPCQSAYMRVYMERFNGDSEFINLWETGKIHNAYKKELQIYYIRDHNLWHIDNKNDAVIYRIINED